MITRIYYRNTFFHIGHLKTIWDNSYYIKEHALQTNEECSSFIYIDDRKSHSNVANVQDLLRYLDVKGYQLVSIKNSLPAITAFLFTLVDQGKVLLLQSNHTISDPMLIKKTIKENKRHYQICLNEEAIGYTQKLPDGKLVLTLLFEFIVRVLDSLLNVTHVIVSSEKLNEVEYKEPKEVFKPMTYVYKDSYTIKSFRYTKKLQELKNVETNPHLLTIKGLQRRYIPASVLKDYYDLAVNERVVYIQQLYDIIYATLNEESITINTVFNPVKLTIQNFPEKTTEFLFVDTKHHKPLSSVVYVNPSELSLEKNTINLNNVFQLVKGPFLQCNDIVVSSNDNGMPHYEITVSRCVKKPPIKDSPMVSWISSLHNTVPNKALFYMYSWFYTGYNRIMPERVVEGFVEDKVYQHLNDYIFVKNVGFFHYDKALTEKNAKTTFIQVLGTNQTLTGTWIAQKPLQGYLH